MISSERATRRIRRPRAPIKSARHGSFNPTTGLACGYLDQFNEAVMLLESLAATPDCAEQFRAWRPHSYQDYLAARPGAAREAGMAAYWAADPRVRSRFDALTAAMIEVLGAIQEVMQSSPPSPATGMLANRAAGWVGRLIVQTRAVIDGTDGPADSSDAVAPPLVPGSPP